MGPTSQQQVQFFSQNNLTVTRENSKSSKSKSKKLKTSTKIDKNIFLQHNSNNMLTENATNSNNNNNAVSKQSVKSNRNSNASDSTTSKISTSNLPIIEPLQAPVYGGTNIIVQLPFELAEQANLDKNVIQKIH